VTAKFSVMEMIAVACSSCGELSDPVPLLIGWRTRPAKAHTVEVAFSQIGWEVGLKFAWCPECKKMPR